MNKAFVVGLTGQTGAGKSTVSEVFRHKGFGVINADIVARQVVEKGTSCLSELAGYFGNEIIDKTGNLDRKKLAGIVFTDKAKLEMLDNIIYPYITHEILNQINTLATQGKEYILLDAPTLFESGADKFCHIIISVLADAEIRKKRIIARDNLTPEQAQNRINSQHDDEFFIARSDYIMNNNGSPEDFGETAQKIADEIRCCYQNK